MMASGNATGHQRTEPGIAADFCRVASFAVLRRRKIK